MKKIFYLICMVIFISCNLANKPVDNSDPSVEKYRLKDEKGNYKILEGKLCRYDPTGDRESFGYTDKFGNIVIEPKYDYAYEFSYGLAAVSIDNKWGFINQFDSLVIPMQYDWVSDFGEYDLNGIAMVKTEVPLDDLLMGWSPMRLAGKTTFINTKGELVTSHSYKTFRYSEEGVMVMIGFDNKWGAINMDAKELFPCRYDSIYFARSMDSLYLYKEGIKEVYSLEDVLKK